MSDVLSEQERNKHSLHTIFLFHYLFTAIHLKKSFSNHK